MEEKSEKTTFEEFRKTDIRVGRIVAAAPLEKARKPAYRLEIDFGPLGRKASSAQLTDLYRPEDLVGRLVLAVVNFPPRRVAGFKSEVLVLGVPGPGGGVVLAAPEREVPLGGRLH